MVILDVIIAYRPNSNNTDSHDLHSTNFYFKVFKNCNVNHVLVIYMYLKQAEGLVNKFRPVIYVTP